MEATFAFGLAFAAFALDVTFTDEVTHFAGRLVHMSSPIAFMTLVIPIVMFVLLLWCHSSYGWIRFWFFPNR